MAIPDYQQLMRPLMELVAREGEIRTREAVGPLADLFGLSMEERREMVPSGRRTRIEDRVQWAASYLVQARVLHRPRRGVLALTDRGRRLLAEHGGPIDNRVLERFEEFRAFLGRGRQGPQAHEAGPGAARGVSGPMADAVGSGATPTEAIRALHQEIVDAVAAELLERLRGGDPAFFEQAVLDLLTAMGYGEGTVTGRAGDGGIDGVVNRDPLGLDPVFVQAKRYGEGQSVGPDAIQAFYGALTMRAAGSGVFFTTARFTSGARDAASRLPVRIILIEGGELARLMVRHGVGVRAAGRLVIPEIDEGYFE